VPRGLLGGWSEKLGEKEGEMKTTPTCPGCGRAAPPPASDEAQEWKINPEIALVVCPACGSSPEKLQAVEDEHNRQRLSDDVSKDSIVFVRGKAKVFADCTKEDVEWLRDEAERQRVQSEAWMEWIKALGDQKEQRE
jgi:hypothetical protein